MADNVKRRPFQFRLRTVLILVASIGAGIGVLQWLFLHRDSPVILGAELDATGKITRQIVFEHSYLVTGYMPGPTRGHETRIHYSHFYLVSPGQRKELPFLGGFLSYQNVQKELCKPIQNSPLWVTAGYFQPGPQIDVVVFDSSGIRTRRTIPLSQDPANPGNDFWYENGNRVLRFYREGKTPGRYDILADRILD